MIENKQSSAGRMPSDIDGNERRYKCSDCGFFVVSERITFVDSQPVCDQCLAAQ